MGADPDGAATREKGRTARLGNSLRGGPDPEATCDGRGPDRRRTIAVIGDGRAARHLVPYFQSQGLEVLTWARRTDGPEALRALPGRVEAIWLLIRDDTLAPFLAEHAYLRERPLVHASGSLTLPGVLGAHPLMTFGPETRTHEFYARMAFVLDAPVFQFESLFPELPNPVFSIRPEERAYYHALCVLAGNFPALLWSKLFHGFESRLGLPAVAARPYLEAAVANLAADPRGALTGPLARDDRETIARNLAALGDDPFAEVYRAFVAAYAAAPVTGGPHP
jgi:hypothetical protein